MGREEDEMEKKSSRKGEMGRGGERGEGENHCIPRNFHSPKFH